MTKIVEYIMLNYTWFLIGAIIILLAIIGSYADKTNFGQGKDKSQDDEKDKNNLGDVPINDVVFGYGAEENPNNSDLSSNSPNDETNTESGTITDNIQDVQTDDGINKSNVSNNNIDKNTGLETNETSNSSAQFDNGISDQQEIENNKKDDFEENFNKFDEEFNTLVPKKDIIDNDILDDIDNLSLDKTQKINLKDIPDLDDVELPEIKSLKTEDDDIWKF